MSNEEKNNQTESSIENLRSLPQKAGQEATSHLLKEIQSAKRTLENLYQIVSEKRRQLTNKQEVETAQAATVKVEPVTVAPTKLDDTASKVFSNDKTPQNNNTKPAQETNKKETQKEFVKDAQKPYQPRENYQPRTQGEGYQPRPQGQGAYQPREGYQPRPQGQNSYQPREGYQPRQQGEGYQPRPQGQREGYQPRQQGAYQPREGYQPRTQGEGYQPRPQGTGGYQPREGYQPRNNQGPNAKPGFNRPYSSDNRQGSAPFNKDGAQKPFGRPKPFVKDAPVIEEVVEVEVRNKFAQANLNKKATKADYDKKAKELTKKQLIKRNFIEGETAEEDGRVITRKPKKKSKEQVIAAPKVIEHAVITTDNLTVKVLAESIGKPVTEIVKKLFLLGIMATINSVIDYETAELVASELGITLEKNVAKTYEEKLTDLIEEADEKDLKPRAPIVTVMGHVDHGKTSLLDAIRQTNVSSGEAGGITQNIGAYMVKTEKGKITFIDTPGHAAFTEMRARGARVTDIAVLVVAADDGIMPQTIEAISHIRAAEVPMVVAINKIDKPYANIEKTKQQLADNNVLAEDWGGDTIMVPVSAHTKEGIDTLLDMITLVAEVKELKANPNRDGMGTVIEAKLDKGRGPIATIIVQNGTLKIGDYIAAGIASGRIRAMIDDQGKEIKKALPSTPVAVVGFDVVPEAGSIATVVDEKMMKELVFERENKQREEKQASLKPVSIDDLFSKAKTGGMKTLNVLIKAGVSGIVEALKQSLEKIKNEEVEVHVVYGAAGAITENDVLLAQTTNAIVVGFNVRPDVNAKKLAEKNNVDVRFYDIIYNVIDDMEAIIKGMLAPKYKEVVVGHAEVLALYKISKIGTIAGCMVRDGRIVRSAKARIYRNNNLLTDTGIDTLRIQKDDVKEVRTGFEFGIKFAGFDDLQIGDRIEAYINEEIKN